MQYIHLLCNQTFTVGRKGLILIAFCLAISCDKPTESVSAEPIEGLGQEAPDLVTEDEISSDQRPHERVKSAINREDWDGLRELIKQETKANEYIWNWEKAPLRVGKMTNVERDATFDGKPCVKYSFELAYADGRPHPHLLEIFVREENTRAELLSFREFGW